MSHEGPIEVTIPARTERRTLDCFACKHYEHHLVRSGRHPIYHALCHHPNARIHALLDAEGREISSAGSSETPAWCPVRKDRA